MEGVAGPQPPALRWGWGKGGRRSPTTWGGTPARGGRPARRRQGWSSWRRRWRWWWRRQKTPEDPKRGDRRVWGTSKGSPRGRAARWAPSPIAFLASIVLLLRRCYCCCPHCFAAPLPHRLTSESDWWRYGRRSEVNFPDSPPVHAKRGMRHNCEGEKAAEEEEEGEGPHHSWSWWGDTTGGRVPPLFLLLLLLFWCGGVEWEWTCRVSPPSPPPLPPSL